MKRFDLGDELAIVPGGNGGIGEGLARGLLECTATVLIAGRNEAKNATAVAKLGKIEPGRIASRLPWSDALGKRRTFSGSLPWQFE